MEDHRRLTALFARTMITGVTRQGSKGLALLATITESQRMVWRDRSALPLLFGPDRFAILQFGALY